MASTVLGNHDLRITQGTLDMWMRAEKGFASTAGFLGYRCAAQVHLEGLREDYTAVLVLTGHAVGQLDGSCLELNRRAVLAAGPQQEFAICLSGDCVVRVVRLPLWLVRARALALLGRDAVGLLTFGAVPAFVADNNAPVTRHVARYLGHQNAQRLDRFVEERLVDWLLRQLPHQYTDALSAVPSAEKSRAIVDFVKLLMDTNPLGKDSMESYAVQAGVTYPELIRAFQWANGQFPHMYLRGVRLDMVHGVLQGARAGEMDVATVARKHGFRNGTEFRSWYRKRFGEWPADTLRRTGKD